jgi:N6-L-threonylcarbamoyladenine synthase
MTPAELQKNTPAIAAEFQRAAVEVLVTKTKRAAEKYKAEGPERSRRIQSILVGGGVSANRALRDALQKLDFPVFLPDMQFTGDNAAMIAFAGYHKYMRTKRNDVFGIFAEPNLAL